MRVVEGWWTVDEVDLLIQHINGLSGLEIIREPIEPYEHMGALLIDCVFQAGISYNTVVKPRVDRMYEDYPEAITTSAFLKVLQREGSDKVARWKPSRKTETLEALTKLLVDENVESEEELQHWLLRDDAREKLACIKGIGPKTIDYMAVLAGVNVRPNSPTHVRAIGYHFPCPHGADGPSLWGQCFASLASA